MPTNVAPDPIRDQFNRMYPTPPPPPPAPLQHLHRTPVYEPVVEPVAGPDPVIEPVVLIHFHQGHIHPTFRV
jgi:hypothetical protein